MHPILILAVAAVAEVVEGVRKHIASMQYPARTIYSPVRSCKLPLPIPGPIVLQDGNGTFTQPIDHGNISMGTFEEFYYWNATFWRGPGSPIVVFLPGETAATKYAVYSDPRYTTVGVLAESLGAAVIIPEHRYYGSSSPFADLTTANLTYLTVHNALSDIVHLAQKFVAPWAEGVPSTARDVPWILTGGSYSAAQTAWIANTMEGTFWAYLAASPLVQAIPSYWEYLLPEIEYGRLDCTAAIAAAIQYLDKVFTTGNRKARQDIKALFGLKDMVHDDDFMAELILPVQSWALQQFYTVQNAYADFCDTIVGSTNKSSPGAAKPVVNVEAAIRGFASFYKPLFSLGVCSDGHCQSTYNASNPIFTDISTDNPYNRQMEWLRCNENIGGWVVGAPSGETTLVSRLITTEYWSRQCTLYFPPGPKGETYGIAQGRTDAMFNHWTGGWSPTKARRIIYSSGEKEVWREMTVSARRRPGGPLQSDTACDMVVDVVPGGWHTSAMFTKNVELNQGCRQVRDREVAQLCDWVQQWPGYNTSHYV